MRCGEGFIICYSITDRYYQNYDHYPQQQEAMIIPFPFAGTASTRRWSTATWSPRCAPPKRSPSSSSPTRWGGGERWWSRRICRWLPPTMTSSWPTMQWWFLVVRVYHCACGKCLQHVREVSGYKIGWFFGKVPNGGQGVIFNPKIYIADLGNFERGLLSMKLIKDE